MTFGQIANVRWIERDFDGPAVLAVSRSGRWCVRRITTFFARLTPKGEVEFVDGPKVAMGEYQRPVRTLRDHQGGLWVTLRRDHQNKDTVACRVTTTDQGQEFRGVGEPELVDAAGCVWLAPIRGMGGDLMTIWAPNGETSTSKIPGRKAGAPLAAGPKGRVYAQTAFGVQECVAADHAKPGKYTLGTVYRPETLEGESLSHLQYSSLGYLIAVGSREGVEDGTMLHLYPLDQKQLKGAAPPAKRPAGKQAADATPETPEFPNAKNLRTWKSATGTSSVEAELVKVAAGKVTLRKKDGSTVTVPIEKLSAEDQKYIRQRLH